MAFSPNTIVPQIGAWFFPHFQKMVKKLILMLDIFGFLISEFQILESEKWEWKAGVFTTSPR